MQQPRVVSLRKQPMVQIQEHGNYEQDVKVIHNYFILLRNIYQKNRQIIRNTPFTINNSLNSIASFNQTIHRQNQYLQKDKQTTVKAEQIQPTQQTNIKPRNQVQLGKKNKNKGKQSTIQVRLHRSCSRSINDKEITLFMPIGHACRLIKTDKLQKRSQNCGRQVNKIKPTDTVCGCKLKLTNNANSSRQSNKLMRNSLPTTFKTYTPTKTYTPAKTYTPTKTIIKQIDKPITRSQSQQQLQIRNSHKSWLSHQTEVSQMPTPW